MSTRGETDRLNIILYGVGALVALGVVYGGLSLVGSGAPSGGFRAVSEAIVTQDRVPQESVAFLHITTADLTYTLERQEAGWGIAERSGYPVKEGLAEDLLNGLYGLEKRVALTADRGRHDALGLGDPALGGSGARVRALDDGETVLFDHVHGVRRGQHYVRDADADQTYRAAGELPPFHRIDTWLALPEPVAAPGEITRVSISPRDSVAYTIIRDPQTGEIGLGQETAGYRLIADYLATPLLDLGTTLRPVDVAAASTLGDRDPLVQILFETNNDRTGQIVAYRLGNDIWVELGSGFDGPKGDWAYKLGPLDRNLITTPLVALASPIQDGS